MHFHCTKCNTSIFLSSGKNTNPDLQFFSPLKPVLPFNPQPRKNLNPCTHKKALQQKTLFTQKKAAAAAANQRTSTQTTRPRFLLLSRCAHKRDKAPGERIHFSLSLSLPTLQPTFQSPELQLPAAYPPLARARLLMRFSAPKDDFPLAFCATEGRRLMSFLRRGIFSEGAAPRHRRQVFSRGRKVRHLVVFFFFALCFEILRGERGYFFWRRMSVLIPV